MTSFASLVALFETLEKTSSSTALRQSVAAFLKKTRAADLEAVTYLCLGTIASEYAGVVLGMADKFVLRAIAKASAVPLDEITRRYQQTGDAGIVASETVGRKKRELRVADVFKTLHEIAQTSGAESQERKIQLLAGLLKEMSPVEAKYVCRIVLGELRLGVAEKTVLDALAIAFTGGKDKVLAAAYTVCPDVGILARTIAEKGIAGIKKIGVMVGRPVQSMLCQRVDSLEEAKEKLGVPFVAEEKYDGERIQAHKNGNKIMLFSRRLDDITEQFPDIVASIKSHVKAKTAVLDGECMPVDVKTGKLLSFQTLMSRKRKHGIEEFAKKIPVVLFVFDLLFLNNESLLEVPYEKRYVLLKKTVKQSKDVQFTTRVVCKDADAAEELFNKVVQQGGEGIVMKDLRGPYQAGTRGWHWIKWKPEYSKALRDTFDLVIVGGFHGMGKRGGTLGSYLCAAYDAKKDLFFTFCKVASGFSEADLELLPKKLAKYTSAHKPARLVVEKAMTPDVWFNPGVVIEVLGAEITESPNHTAGGLALRFPRFLKYRNDKSAEEATTVQEIVRLAKK